MTDNLNTLTVQPVILAGGSGGGLWPLSRSTYPKQLLEIGGPQSLLQETVQRLKGLGDNQDAPKMSVLGPLMVCHERHRFLIGRQLKDSQPALSGMVLEPEGRHTAPAVSVAAQLARQPRGSVEEHDPDPLLLILPADHIVRSVAVWQAAVCRALTLAQEGKMVALGVAPDRPESAYGYIRKGARVGANREGFAIEAFVEKPSEDAARSFMSAGKYVWNSGIYAMRTSVWLAAIGHASADISAAAELAVANGEWDGAFFRPEREAFINSPSQSLDYAVMEKLVRAFGSAAWRDSLGRAIGAAVVEMEAGWADVGTWHALLQTQADSTADGNATLGDVVDIGNENCVLVSTSRLVAGVGLRDIVAVETPDAVLVAHRRDGERVAEVVKQLREGGRSEADVHRRAHRPWGSAEPLDEGEGHRVQHLVIHPGESITLQVHERRTEHWTVVRGQATVERDGVVHRLDRGQAMTIPPGAQHRLENAADEPLEVIEVQTGDLDRGDIQRLTAS